MGNSKRDCWIGVLFVGLSMGLSQQASGDENIDLPAGVLYPSNSSAIWLSPPALGGRTSKIADLNLRFKGSWVPDAEASYSRSGGTTGFGLGFLKDDSTVYGALAGGVSAGKLHVGVGVIGDLQRFSLTRFQGGIFYLAESGVGIGVAFPQLMQPTGGWTLALGGKTGMFRIESDFEMETGGEGLSFSSVAGSISLLAIPVKELSLLVVNYFNLIPNLHLISRTPGLGANYWFTSSFAGYGLLNTTYGSVLLGAKILF